MRPDRQSASAGNDADDISSWRFPKPGATHTLSPDVAFGLFCLLVLLASLMTGVSLGAGPMGPRGKVVMTHKDGSVRNGVWRAGTFVEDK